MRFLRMAFFLSVSFYGVSSMACGDISGCTSGFGHSESGGFYVKDFNNSDLRENLQLAGMSTQGSKIVIVDTDGKGNITIAIVTLPDGTKIVVRPSNDWPASSVRKFYPDASTANKPYAYFVGKELLYNNTSDSAVPFGAFVNPNGSCTGSCRKIIGNLDSVGRFGAEAAVVSGWACDRGVDKKIRVHIYAGGAAGHGGTHIASGDANMSSKDSAKINSACGTTGGHRFKVRIPAATANKYRGQKIYVHGLSESNQSNLTIAQSGTVVIPDPKVKGHIDGLDLAYWTDPLKRQVWIHGWACQEGINKSISVRVYAGAPQGRGGVLMAATQVANMTSEAAVSNECGTSLKKHRFKILMSAGLVYQQAGQRLFVHGVSTNGSPNNILDKSGYYSVPTPTPPNDSMDKK